jgi:dynein heavy chain
MRVKALDCFVRLKESEELVLKGLQRDIEVVLLDTSLIQNLGQSHKTATKVAKALKEISKGQDELLEARSKYQPVAARAAMLFFVVKDLSKLEHVYQFSLKWFMDIFEAELSAEEVPNPTGVPIDPVIDLNERLTQSVYQKVCLSIF